MGSGPASPDSLALGLYPGKPKNNCTAHAWVSPSPSPGRSWLSPVSGRFGGRRATAGCGRTETYASDQLGRVPSRNRQIPPIKFRAEFEAPWSKVLGAGYEGVVPRTKIAWDSIRFLDRSDWQRLKV